MKDKIRDEYKTILSVLAALIIIFLLVVLSTNYGESIKKDFDRNGEQIVLYINLYQNERELMNAIEEWNPDNHRHKGLAGWGLDHNHCEIFAIEPKYVDDDNTTTIGHEVLHCVWGSYHK